MYRGLKSFELFEPATVNEAVQFLFTHSGRAKILAGGVDLVMKMRLRKIVPEYVVSLHKIPGLDRITGDGESGLRIGALVKLCALERSPAAGHYPVLGEGIRAISAVQVKNMGTAIGQYRKEGSPWAKSPGRPYMILS